MKSSFSKEDSQLDVGFSYGIFIIRMSDKTANIEAVRNGG